MAVSDYIESVKRKDKGGVDIAPGKARQAFLRTDEGKEEKKARKSHNERMGPKDKETKQKLRKDAKKADVEKGREILSKRKKGGTTTKKHIMELPTNVPRMMAGANLMNPDKADLDKDGNLSSYEKARGRAIEKSMNEKNKTRGT